MAIATLIIKYTDMAIIQQAILKISEMLTVLDSRYDSTI